MEEIQKIYTTEKKQTKKHPFKPEITYQQERNEQATN